MMESMEKLRELVLVLAQVDIQQILDTIEGMCLSVRLEFSQLILELVNVKSVHVQFLKAFTNLKIRSLCHLRFLKTV